MKKKARKAKTATTTDTDFYVRPYAALIEKIGRKEFGVETLETRNSDSLDFYDVGVASMKRALEAAFLAGAQVGAALTVSKE